MDHNLKYLSFLLLIFLAACDSVDMTFIHKGLEIRRGEEGRQFVRFDTIKSIDKEGVIYSSKFQFDSSYYFRTLRFPNPNSPIGTNLRFEHENRSLESTLLLKKSIIVDGYKVNYVKYFYEDLLAEDNQFVFFFSTDYGIFLERYWVENIYKSLEVNHRKDRKLKTIIDTLISRKEHVFKNK